MVTTVKLPETTDATCIAAWQIPITGAEVTHRAASTPVSSKHPTTTPAASGCAFTASSIAGTENTSS